MKLSQKERDILACTELRAEASLPLIRKETGYRDHTIRYAMRSMQQRGIIVPIPFINLHPLGYIIFNIFFSIGSQKKKTKQDFLKALLGTKEVIWLAEFGGDFQYGLAICAKHISTALDLLTGLSEKYDSVFFEKSISTQFSATTYYRKYLSSKKFSVPSLKCATTKDFVDIDELDDTILQGLAGFQYQSHRQLAQQLKIPLSTLELRYKKLQSRGIIAGHIFAVDPTRFGMQAFKLLIYSKGINPELMTNIRNYAEAHKNIVYLIESLGSWDCEIGIEVEQPEEVTDIIQEIYEQFGGSITSVKVLTKFRDLKFRWYPS